MILLIDTSTTELFVALATDEGVIVKESRQTASTGERGIHDARLAIETERLLDEVNASPASITRIGIVIGPGSFTGLRIGLSFAKGLAFTTGASIVAITQHEALASAFSDEIDVVITPGYRPGLYYVAKHADWANVELRESLGSITGRILAHASLMSALADALPDSSYAEIAGSALARLTTNATTLYTKEEIDNLEPLYVTDFTPGVR